MKKLLLTAFALFGFANGAYATDIELTWGAPTSDDDGKPLASLDGYNIYYSVDNVVQSPIVVASGVENYTLTDVAPGSYTFQITALGNGDQESDRSDPQNVDIGGSGAPAKVEITVRVIE